MSFLIDGNGECLTAAVVHSVYKGNVELVRVLSEVVGAGHSYN